jgi:hypothetical protein
MKISKEKADRRRKEHAVKEAAMKKKEAEEK